MFNMTVLTITSLRENLFNIFDKIIASGVPLEVERKGNKLRINLVGKINKLDNLIPHDSIVGHPDDLVKETRFPWKEPKNI